MTNTIFGFSPFRASRVSLLRQVGQCGHVCLDMETASDSHPAAPRPARSGRISVPRPWFLAGFAVSLLADLGFLPATMGYEHRQEERRQNGPHHHPRRTQGSEAAGERVVPPGSSDEYDACNN